MLRVIIYLKPEIEKNIINFRKTKVNFREKLLEDQKMDIDQSIIIFTITDSFRIFEAITTGQKSLKKNTAFKASHFDLTIVEVKKIERFREKISETDKRINEYKLIMERILIQKEEFEQEIENLEIEK